VIPYKIEFAFKAEQDLLEIAAYLRGRLFAPQAALDFSRAVKEAVAQLAVMPRRHALLSSPRLARRGYRKLPVKHYLVFCLIDDVLRVVRIERILFTKRNWTRIL
jgi:plasmid stabilization system protein ParE